MSNHTKRVNLRISATQLRVIARAAEMLDETLSEFVRRAGKNRADQVLASAYWLVYRHGRNSRNQPSSERVPVLIVRADSRESAKEAAVASGVVYYPNQYLTAEHETDADPSDWSRCKPARRRSPADAE